MTYHESEIMVLGEEQFRHLQVALDVHGPPNRHGVDPVFVPLCFRLVRHAVDLSIASFLFVRVESLHREILAAHDTLEALLVEDGLPHGSHRLCWVDALRTTLTLVHRYKEKT